MFVKCSLDPGTGDPGAPDEPRRKLTGRGGERSSGPGPGTPAWGGPEKALLLKRGQGSKELKGKERCDPSKV